MNCESIQTLLDHSDLSAISDSERRTVQSHIESCPNCAALVAVHDEFLAMRIPSVPADLEQRCFERIASVPGRRAKRWRAGPVVLGALVIAAAAAIVGPIWFEVDDEAGVADDTAGSQSTSVQSTADTATDSKDIDPDSLAANDDDVAAGLATTALASAESFVVELTRLVQADQTQLSQLFSDWFHAALVEELSLVPNLVLIEAANDVEISSIPMADPPIREFSFDMDTSAWPGDFDIRLAAGAGVGEDWVGKQWTAVSADGQGTGEMGVRGSMQPGVEASPEFAAVLATEILEILRVELFPADASALASEFARYEAILGDRSAPYTERGHALDAAAQLARRANDPDITARLVDGVLIYAAQIEDALLNSSTFAGAVAEMTATELAAVRAELADSPASVLQYLRGSGDDRVIGPMSEMLLYDQSEEVRLAATRILGEFAGDAVARATLEFAADSDASASVREKAGNYLLDDAVHLESIFAVVRDSSLSDGERLRVFLLDDPLQFVEKGFSVDSDTVDVVANLIERSDVDARADFLRWLSYTQSPSFVPVYLDRLRNDPSSYVRSRSLGILSEHLSQPGVERALEAAAAEDPAGNVRSEAARILNETSR